MRDSVVRVIYLVDPRRALFRDFNHGLLEEVRSGRVAILVASIQPPDQMVKYLTTHRLNGFSVLQAVESGLQVSATPVVVLLDSSGNVLDSWAGLQSQSGESTIVAAIRRAAS